MFKSSVIWSNAWIVVVLLPLSGFGHASTTYATITGTVTDPSGAVVPKATISATNVATGIASTTKSNAAGAYTIAQLNEGSYTLKAEAQGFKDFVVEDVNLVSGAVRRLDVHLQLSAAATTIEDDARRLWAFFNNPVHGLQNGPSGYRFGHSRAGEVPSAAEILMVCRKTRATGGVPALFAIAGTRGELYTAIRSVSCNASINGPAEGLFNRENRTSPGVPHNEPAGYGS